MQSPNAAVKHDNRGFAHQLVWESYFVQNTTGGGLPQARHLQQDQADE